MDVELVLAAADPHYVFWAEHVNGEPTLTAAPILVQDELADKLFAQVPSAILTSATLSTNGSFAYTKERIGLWEADELILDSPFNYRTGCTLCAE